MFDPHHLSYRNRRIQKQAQILRPKGTTDIPQKVYTPNDYKEMQRILIANKISAYIPEPQLSLPILIDGISTDGSTVNIPLSSFYYTETEQQNGLNVVMYFHMDGEIIDFYAFNQDAETGATTIPANSFVFAQGERITEYVFHSPTIGYFLASSIGSTDKNTKLSFNSDIFQLTGLSESS